ncbi:MAG: hypothetical protein LC107_13010 [Chitinophagales bacterium]|nr:hypothetical protein [Chitinophagales bacterium]
MRLLKKMTLCFMIGAGTLITSCEKENQILDDAQLSYSPILVVGNPIVENGTLKFADKEVALAYMMNLRAELEDDIEGNIESVLAHQEVLGFTSLLRLVESNGDSASIFIAPYLNAMLNANYEFIIGDSIYVHKNHEETWIASSDDEESIAVFRAKEPGTYIEEEEINERMVIDGKREIEMAPPGCCPRYGKTIRKDVLYDRGRRLELNSEVEIKRGFLWGMYVYTRTNLLVDNRKNTKFYALKVEAFGKFRNKSCDLKYTDYDVKNCVSCSSVSVSIFHYDRSRDRFYDNEVGGTIKLMGLSGGWVNYSIYPPCR